MERTLRKSKEQTFFLEQGGNEKFAEVYTPKHFDTHNSMGGILTVFGAIF